MSICCCIEGMAGMMRNSGLEKLSWCWCVFIHAEISARHDEIYVETMRSSNRNDGGSWVPSVWQWYEKQREQMIASRWCIYWEQKHTEHWSVRKPCGYINELRHSLSPRHNKRSLCKMGHKPVEDRCQAQSMENRLWGQLRDLAGPYTHCMSPSLKHTLPFISFSLVFKLKFNLFQFSQ